LYLEIGMLTCKNCGKEIYEGLHAGKFLEKAWFHWDTKNLYCRDDIFGPKAEPSEE